MNAAGKSSCAGGFDNGVCGISVVAYGAGVENFNTGDLMPYCSVGVAEKTELCAGKANAVAERIHVHFNAVAVTVGEKYAHSVNFLKTAFRGDKIKVAVSSDAPEGDGGIALLKAFSVPHAVAEMNYKIGGALLHRTEHIFFASVGIAHYKDFHVGHLPSL